MKARFIQVDCIEGNKIDHRQSDAVLKHKPDMVFLEYPMEGRTPDSVFNKYKPESKPRKLLENQINSLKKHSKDTSWIKSDIKMWENIEKLWENGHDVKIYKVDAPRELVTVWNEVWKNMYPCAKKNWLWWVRIYLREKYMAKNINWVLSRYRLRDNLVVLVFLQSFHWEHVQFLLNHPSADKVWEYYFGNFPEISQSNIAERIKENNKIFYKYWKRVSEWR
jgi:hypothetical protein